MKKLLLLMLIGLFLSCKNDNSTNQTDSKENLTTTTNKTPSESALSGTFEGTFPCDGCDGIETQLVLLHNYTYVITSKALGDSSLIMPIVDSGSYAIDDNTLIITDVGEISKKFRIEDKQLIGLDDEGDELKGDGKNDYTLSKTK